MATETCFKSNTEPQKKVAIEAMIHLKQEEVLLSMNEEEEKKLRQKHSPRGAEINVGFVNTIISPILLDYLSWNKEEGFATDFNLRPQFDSEYEQKFIRYDGVKLSLCRLKGEAEGSFEAIREIRGEKDTREIFQKHGEGAKRALLAFGTISRRGIISEIMNKIDPDYIIRFNSSHSMEMSNR